MNIQKTKLPRLITTALTTAFVVSTSLLAFASPSVAATGINAGKPKPTNTPLSPTPTTIPPTVTPAPSGPGTWVFGTNLVTPRYNHTATLLQDGRVLVVGGVTTNGHVALGYELYSPINGTRSSGSTPVDFQDHTATRLQDGRVLFAAGSQPSNSYLFNPDTSTWTQTGTRLVYRAAGATATLLADGRVLLAGGNAAVCYPSACSGPSPVVSEIYDPATGTWSLSGTMVTYRRYHVATLLPDGRVLVAGGIGAVSVPYLSAAEIFDPSTSTWSGTGDLASARSYAGITKLADGRVLVVGGTAVVDNSGAQPVNSAEIYMPATGAWSSAGTSVALGGLYPALALLPNGRVLGEGANGALLYDATTNVWLSTGNLNTPRILHTATVLNTGKVLVVAGHSPTTADVFVSTELYDP